MTIRFLTTSMRALGTAVVALMLTLSPLSQATAQSFTEWGFPQPYERISAKSVE